MLDSDLEDVMCRQCGEAEETGAHVALICREGEGLGWCFGSWEHLSRRGYEMVSKGGSLYWSRISFVLS